MFRNRKHIIISLSLLSFGLFSCNQQEDQNSTSTSKPNFVNDINKAHNFDDFKNAGVLQADIKLSFHGKTRLEAQMLFDTKTQETALYHKDGRQLIFTNDTVWMSPDTVSYPGARFDIFTWSYFATLPFKLNDDGTHFNKFENKKLNGQQFDVEKLSFGKNVGDAPDDWYVLYKDKENNLLHAAAYIVTLNKSVEESEKDPHAIVYNNYKSVDGIQIAQNWMFYGWDKKNGLTDTLGKATLSNIKFTPRTPESFKISGDKVEVTL